MRIGIVSGYFNPVHMGHLEYIAAAKENCDYLIVIVNNDLQVTLKGSKKFMDQNHRAKIMSCFRNVDQSIIAEDTDKTVCKTLECLHEKYHENNVLFFFNSGDRIGNNAESTEIKVCEKIGIKYVAIPLPKRYSSSELLKNL